MAKDFSNIPGLPIGLRNNNPGNLRPGLLPWVGQTGTNGGFCKFKDLSFGLRALAVDLSNKITSDGLDTITDIISKYAPPSENNTAAYINAVSDSTGWDANEEIDFNSGNLANLMQAVIEHENGAASSQISSADIAEGISLIPQSIINRVKSFFSDNPAIATASAVGVIAVVIVIVLALFKPNALKFKK
jgi:translation elongation factor EF-1beta